MESLSPVHRDCTDRELNLALPEGEFKFGKYLHTMQIDMDIYLQYLREQFTSKGKDTVLASIIILHHNHSQEFCPSFHLIHKMNNIDIILN